MKLKFIILIYCAVVNVICVSAQDLNKEITIEKEIVPEQRSATRLVMTPKVSLPAIEQKKMSLSERRSASEIKPVIATLEPVAYDDRLISSYDGYIDLGYFPSYNVALSAGYRVVNTADTRLNAWLQYDGTVYDADMYTGDELTLRNHTLTAGLNFSHWVNKYSAVTVDIDYSYMRYNTPVVAFNDALSKLTFEDGYNQNVNNIQVGLAWNSRIEELKYGVGVDFDHFAYGQQGYYYDYPAREFVPVVPQSGAELRPVRENNFTIKGGVAKSLSSSREIALDVNASFLDYNRNSAFIRENSECRLIEIEPTDYGIISLNPHYDYKTDDFSTRIGAMMDFTINDGNAFNIAPDIDIDWSPLDYLSLYAHFGGGQHLNTLKSLMGYSKYAAPMFSYGKSSIPLVIDFGVVIGAWRGFHAELFGGYAKADDWLMPDVVAETNFYSPTDIDGWHGVVEMGYNYRDAVKLGVRYEFASNDYDKGYYLWRDRAGSVLGVTMQVTPVKSLDINVGYELRADRKIMHSGLLNVIQIMELGDVDNLSVGAIYRLSEATSIFARVDNLLNNKYLLFSNIPSRGTTGIFGFSYKF